MPVSADQAASIKSNIAAVEKDLDTHSQNFFIFFLKKFPALQNKFPKYKGKNVDTLATDVADFPRHVKGVVSDVLAFYKLAGDAGAFSAKGKQIIADHTGRGTITNGDYAQLFEALLEYLGQQLGGACNAGAWSAAKADALAALK